MNLMLESERESLIRAILARPGARARIWVDGRLDRAALYREIEALENLQGWTEGYDRPSAVGKQSSRSKKGWGPSPSPSPGRRSGHRDDRTYRGFQLAMRKL